MFFRAKKESPVRRADGGRGFYPVAYEEASESESDDESPGAV